MLRTDAAPPRRRRATGSVVVLLVPLLAACGTGFGEDEPSDQAAVVAPSQLPVPVASGPRVAASGTVNVLTGEPAPDGRVLAVAVDGAAGPPAGLDQADVVYVRERQDGTSGLLALFQTEVPARVGPVRAAGAGDVAVLDDHGPVVLASAGADPDATAALAATDLQLVSPDAGGEGFVRDPAREAPSDVLGDGPALLGRAPGSGVAQDVGFRFGPLDEDAEPTAAGSYAWSASDVAFSWSADDDAWRLERDGEVVRDEADEPVRADNVLFTDATGGADDADAVTLLRDGAAVEGSLEDLRLDVGTTWVVLMEPDGSPTLTDG